MKKLALVTAVVAALGVAPAFAKIGVNVGAISVMPDESSTSLNVVESIAGLTPGSTGVAVNNNTQLGLTFDYAIDDAWSVQLIAATPFSHDITATGALAGLAIGDTKHLPPTLMFQYNWKFDNGIEPFVGVGLNYTWFFDTQADPQLVSALTDLGAITAADTVDLKLSNSWGYALQAGFNVNLNADWGLHFMVSTMDIDTTGDVRVNGTTVQSVDVEIDPIVAMAGVRYRF
ncbi:OmpW/AlkL family protein [Pseudidiomarina taiwanensis]|uniref:OmpW family protein n=1 Tax=Pseudidiomarina taiwanensis TaxID=337250 RepID=A0A432ZEG0_9GAMM|nr:OmpW family outer membrane protein [Pseudidiomarina taiwanensis]RUO76365.1 hypothetical protein CWI83_08355 [Pseudidiomarina taiwanensis]